MGCDFSTFPKVDSTVKASTSPSNTRPSSPGHMTPMTSSAPITGSVGWSTEKSSVGGNSIEELSPQGWVLPAPNLKVFNFAELRNATRNFKPDSLLGEGGFGKVYKAWLDETTLTPTKSGLGIMVAVKKLNPESMQGFEEWKSEVNFLGRLSHPNLVKLLGYCLEDRELLLVYEFMPKGSLENHLFRRGAFYQPLPWSLRLKIVIGAARGLVFLHKDKGSIIYRDFKASNILLDSNYNAKLSDFGLAKYGPTGGDSHVTTRVMGTYGYAAPEYVATGHLYVKSDVYGFGVVLLETLSGLRAHDLNRPTGQQNLVDYAKPLLSDKRKINRFMDASLGDQYSAKVAFEAGQLALRCLTSNPKHRPSMEEVLSKLEQIEALKAKPKDVKSTTARPAARGRGPKPSQLRSCAMQGM